MQNCLDVRNLSTSFATEAGKITVVEGVSFKVEAGKTLGIVGESGCGKSVTSLSVLRLLPQPSGVIEAGEIWFDGRDLLKLPIEEMYKIRGRSISMIFQEPLTALNPVHTIERQISEVFELHFPTMKAKEVKSECLNLLKMVGIPEPEKRLICYPHQLSGGMRQRVVIAIALALKPKFLFADEPTTALDVTIQAQILKLIKNLQQEVGMGVVFITHDLGVIAQVCDEVAVMYAGRIVEQGPVENIFSSPSHPYTQGLLKSIPRLTTPRKSKLPTIEGMVPDVFNFPQGCRFHTRCQYQKPKCHELVPTVEQLSSTHQVSCHFHRELRS